MLQAALAAEDAAAAEEARPDDTWSEASSVVSGMSAYTSATGTQAGTSVTGSSGRPASTVGGRKPQKRRQKVSNMQAATQPEFSVPQQPCLLNNGILPLLAPMPCNLQQQ